MRWMTERTTQRDSEREDESVPSSASHECTYSFVVYTYTSISGNITIHKCELSDLEWNAWKIKILCSTFSSDFKWRKRHWQQTSNIRFPQNHLFLCTRACLCARAFTTSSNSSLCWRLTLSSVTVSRFVLFIMICCCCCCFCAYVSCVSAKKNPLNLIGICFVIVIRCLHAPRCHMSYQFYIQITSCVRVYTCVYFMILTMRYSPFSVCLSMLSSSSSLSLQKSFSSPSSHIWMAHVSTHGISRVNRLNHRANNKGENENEIN